MLDCYTLSLLSLSLTLSIIIIIIISINAILEEKEKPTRWESSFTNKTVWTCLYACYLYNNFLCLLVWSFSCKTFFFFRIYNCVCTFDENKNKNLFKKKEIQKMIVITEQIQYNSKAQFFNNTNCHYRTNFAKVKDQTFE